MKLTTLPSRLIDKDKRVGLYYCVDNNTDDLTDLTFDKRDVIFIDGEEYSIGTYDGDYEENELLNDDSLYSLDEIKKAIDDLLVNDPLETIDAFYILLEDNSIVAYKDYVL